MENILVIAGQQFVICLGFFPRPNWVEITKQNLAQKINQDLFCSISNTLNLKAATQSWLSLFRLLLYMDFFFSQWWRIKQK